MKLLKRVKKLRLQNILIKTNISFFFFFLLLKQISVLFLFFYYVVMSIGGNSTEVNNDEKFYIELFRLDRLQNPLRTLKVDKLFSNSQTFTHIQDVTKPWLLYQYFHELYSLHPTRITFTA